MAGTGSICQIPGFLPLITLNLLFNNSPGGEVDKVETEYYSYEY